MGIIETLTTAGIELEPWATDFGTTYMGTGPTGREVTVVEVDCFGCYTAEVFVDGRACDVETAVSLLTDDDAVHPDDEAAYDAREAYAA